MNKEEKHELVLALTEQMKEYGNFYITDTSNLTVAKVNDIRRKFFESDITMQVAKNSLIKKALESLDSQKYAGVLDSLHKVTALMFSESPKEPAMIISSFRTDSKTEKPVLKAAYIDSSVFIGDKQLDTLVNLKSKEQLIGEIIGLLQSPAKNVISGLQSGGNKLAGIVKTLQERG